MLRGRDGLRREVSEDILFVLSAEVCPHSHVTNDSAGKGWVQLLGSVVTTGTVRLKFSLAWVRLSRGGGLRRLLAICGFSFYGTLTKNKGRGQDRCDEERYPNLPHFDPPFQAGKRNR